MKSKTEIRLRDLGNEEYKLCIDDSDGQDVMICVHDLDADDTSYWVTLNVHDLIKALTLIKNLKG